MEHIETIELGSSQSSITFSSIPQDYDDLKILLSTRTDRANVQDGVEMLINGSLANFTFIGFRGDGSGVFNNDASISLPIQTSSASATSNTFGNSEIYISNYTQSTNKSISSDSVTENNGTSATATLRATLWSNSSAISSLGFTPRDGTNFVTGSVISLYAVSAGGDGTVSTA